MKILVINGPNINMLGIREPGIYGKNTFADLLALLERTAKEENLDIQCISPANRTGLPFYKSENYYYQPSMPSFILKKIKKSVEESMCIFVS